ncbi:hypothetical protein RUM43_009250 [Polyplax serrata]|uniref:Ig-like domain-containing protein n=1 Tax=Polyplax serrata TaxID=468196 RepID=A0AAN8PAI5_POLSC
MNPIMLDDDARYQCQVSAGPQGQRGIRSRFATVTVLVPPEPPKIIQGESLVTTEDREIELECISMAGKPAAEITWIDGHGNVLTENIDYIVEPLSDNRRFTAKSVLKLMPRKHHHNTTFTCQAQNAADRTYRSAKLKLQVKYAPKVDVKILTGIGPSGRISEGADVTLLCEADANPSEMTYKWYVNNELVEGEPTTELVIRNVTRKLHDAMVKCKVHNSVGESEAFETLEVSYGPRFRTKPKIVQADVGSTVTLTCDVDGNPPPDIVWIHKNTERVVGTSANLTLTVDNESGGTYQCKASIMGFQEIGAEGAIYIKGRPTIISHRTQFGVVGDNVRLECVVFSIPRPSHISWSFEGVDIESANHKYSILEDPLPNGIKSTLLIHESESRNFGAYNCSVINSYGMDSVEIVLKAQSKSTRPVQTVFLYVDHHRDLTSDVYPAESFPLPIILMGVIVVVIVIVAIALVVILCQRNSKKPPIPVDCNGGEKTCKESDRSSNISDLKLELRTGSSVSNVHCELEYGPDSETGSESVVTRIGVPLAGPVSLGTLGSLSHTSTLQHTGALPQVNGGDRLFRYSAEFADPVFPPKDGQTNGYVPYVDYSRDYTPPAVENNRDSTAVANGQHSLRLSTVPTGVDPRYSAAYGNPYLRSSNTSLPPPHATTGLNNNPAPPPYSATRQNGAVPQLARLPSSPTSQYIVPAREQITIKRGTLATHV